MAKEIEANENTSGPANGGFGQEPVASPAARGWTIVLALLLIALAVVAGREVWAIVSGDGQSWLQPFIGMMAAGELQDWMIWVGVVAIIVGLILLFVAFKPRPRTHMQVSSTNSSIWLRPVDVARLASATARKVPGVRAASTQAKRKGGRVDASVLVNGNVEDPTLESRVSEAVYRSLAPLAGDTQVAVSVQPVSEVDSNV